MKGRAEVIENFNEIVNMTVSELETWLNSDDSKDAGWQKNNAAVDAETIGHESGVKIIEILKSNREKKPQKYTGKQVEHMRKVVAYCKRHLAQESSSLQLTPEDEVKKTKSYASLKNWGHDFLRAQRKKDAIQKHSRSSVSNGRRKSANDGSESSKAAEPEDEEDEDKDDEEEDKKRREEEEEEEENEDTDQEEQVGEKRKKTRQQTGANKKRETQRGGAAKKAKQNSAKEEGAEEYKETNGKDEGSDETGPVHGREKDADSNGSRKKEAVQDKTKKGPKHGPSKGDTVSWNWGSGQPHGKVLDVKEKKTSIKTKRGNEVSRTGRPEDPAVILDAGKSKAIKLAHELN